MTQRSSPADDLRRWSSVDRYLGELLDPAEPALEAALSASRAAGLPDIQVSPLQGRFLFLLAKALGSRRILEIGTLGGYSAIWLSRALPPGGQLVTLERDPVHVAVARANLARAGLASLVEIREGDALGSLPTLADERADPFDLVFIDADKPNYPRYLDWAIRLSRPGGVILADNVVRRGDVADPESSDPNVQGVRGMIERLARDRRVSATALQTVGRKGHDGFVLALILPELDSSTSVPGGRDG